jgi:trehalose-6-phosphate synthase
MFRVLPTRKELLLAMMDADLIGFHTFDYARHFLSCIKRVLDLDFETLPGGVLGQYKHIQLNMYETYIYSVVFLLFIYSFRY